MVDCTQGGESASTDMATRFTRAELSVVSSRGHQQNNEAGDAQNQCQRAIVDKSLAVEQQATDSRAHPCQCRENGHRCQNDSGFCPDHDSSLGSMRINPYRHDMHEPSMMKS